MKLSPFKILYSIPLLVLFCSSCEDKAKISENEALKATIAEMGIELKDVKGA